MSTTSLYACSLVALQMRTCTVPHHAQPWKCSHCIRTNVPVERYRYTCYRYNVLQQVGVLQPSPDMGDTCLVEWASGSQRVYETGWLNRFELVHLEVSPTSGAPVVRSDWTGMKNIPRALLLWDGSELQQPEHLSASQLVGGTAVERGTHWVYEGAEPGVGSIYAAASARRAQRKGGKPLASAIWHVQVQTRLCLRFTAVIRWAQSQFVRTAYDLARQHQHNLPLAGCLSGAVHVPVTDPLRYHGMSQRTRAVLVATLLTS